MAAAARSVR